MPFYVIKRRVDAYVDYVVRVGGSDPRDATEFAQENEDRLIWEEDGTCEFDARIFVALDDEGCEIDGSECGDF